MRHLFYAVAVAGELVCGLALADPVTFTCPREGTVGWFSIGKVVFHGASPSDPLVCRLTNNHGKDEARLFNYYPADAPERAQIRDELSKLLSGETIAVSFAWTSADRLPYQDNWVYIGRGSINIGDRNIKAERFELNRVSTMASNDFRAKWRLWLDPATGIWVKGQMQLLSQGGLRGSPSWQYQSISEQ